MVELSGSLWSRYMAQFRIFARPSTRRLSHNCRSGASRAISTFRTAPINSTKVGHLPGSVTHSVMPAGWAWCSGSVAGECCCRVLLPHLSPVVIDHVDQADGVPAVRRVTGWITGLPGHLDSADAVLLNSIRVRCPELDAAVRHVAGFARMIKDLSGDKNTLTGWMGAAVDADLHGAALVH